MYDLFMTRYLMVAFVPLLVLGLTAFALLIPLRFRLENAARCLVILIILLMGLHNRTQLMSAVDYRGLWKYLASYAAEIKQARGIILGEYPRLVAPFEHIFGIPSLGLYNERRDDYRVAEGAWETIMRRFPDRPAFFVTPFRAPCSRPWHPTRTAASGC